MSSTSNTWTVASRKGGKVASSPKGKKPKTFLETMPRIEAKRMLSFINNLCYGHSLSEISENNYNNN